jgi:hypothetical protein
MASDTGYEFSSDARRSSEYFLSDTRQSSANDEETPSHSTSSTSVSESDGELNATERSNPLTLKQLLLDRSLLPESNDAYSSEIEYVDPPYSMPAATSTQAEGDGRNGQDRRISFTHVSAVGCTSNSKIDTMHTLLYTCKSHFVSFPGMPAAM